VSVVVLLMVAWASSVKVDEVVVTAVFEETVSNSVVSANIRTPSCLRSIVTVLDPLLHANLPVTVVDEAERLNPHTVKTLSAKFAVAAASSAWLKSDPPTLMAAFFPRMYSVAPELEML
jgi:hypothetical protein